MAAPVALIRLLPYLAKGPGMLKALYTSKAFWPLLTAGLFTGQEALSQVGKAGERGVAREQIAAQKLMAEAAAEASKMGYKESQKHTKEYTETLMKARREEVKMAKEQELLQSFTASQDRQMALVLQAVQA